MLDAGLIAQMLAPLSRTMTQEACWTVTLDIYARLVDVHEVARGGRDHVDVQIPIILESVLRDGTDYFAIVHNHPSGSAMPSTADGQLTEAVQEAADAAGLTLIDHVVLGRDREYFSFFEGQLWRIPS